MNQSRRVLLLFGILLQACQEYELVPIGQNNNNVTEGEGLPPVGDPCQAYNAPDFFAAMRKKYKAVAHRGPSCHATENTFTEGQQYQVEMYSDGIKVTTNNGVMNFVYGEDGANYQVQDDFGTYQDDYIGATGSVKKLSMNHSEDPNLRSKVIADKNCNMNDNKLLFTVYPNYTGFGSGGPWQLEAVQ